MYNDAKQDKFRQIQDILRLHFLEECTFAEITKQTGVSRPTARKYIDKFKEMASCDDLALKDSYKDNKRRVPFPTRWNKYVRKMVDSYAHHPKRVATPAMCKKIIKISADKNAMNTFRQISSSEGKTPSYDTVAKVIREHRENNPPTE
jgi:hypothetical protein